MEDIDVAIIGGGVSGLYAAWRIGVASNLKTTLFESDSRTGGRILTQDIGGFPVDVGAMR